MADYIDREFALSQVPEYFTSIDELIDVPFFLKSMPSVDAIKVVRCKDCKHCDKEREQYCWLHDINVTDNDFCKWGEKE